MSKGKQVHCEQCDKWMMPNSYASHQRSHNNERPFACDVTGCKQAFTAYSSLQHHKRGVHEGLRPYKCDQCDARCSQMSDLRRHQLEVHELYKPHACTAPYCTYKTAKLSTLRRHCKSKHKGYPLPALVKR